MKKFIFFCFLILAYGPFHSQNLNKARHLREDVTSNMVSIHSKNFYIERTIFDSLNFVAINDSGRTLFKRRLNIGDYSVPVPPNIVVTRDKKLFMFAKLENSCDVMSYINLLAKIDTSGQIIFQVQSTISTGVYDMFICATEHPDSSFYLIGDNGPIIKHFSKFGAYTGSLTMPATFSSMTAILALQNGNLLINGLTNNGRQNLLLSASNGSVINQQSTTCTITAFQESVSGLIYGLDRGGAIYTFSNNLQALNNSIAATSTNMRLRDFKIRNDSVFCAGYLAPNNAPYYAVLNSALNVLYQHQSSYKNIFPTGISINNKNKISIITRGTSNSNFRLSFSGLYQTSVTGSLTSRYDIGVVGYSPISATVYNNSWVATNGLAANLAVQVKNFTNDTVHHFYLNHMNYYCAGVLHKKYANTIAPYSTITVTTGVFFSDFNMPANYQFGTFPLQFCVSTSIPNYENDVEISNDSWCGPLLIMTPTGLNEKSLVNSHSVFFPNPTHSNFNILSESIIKRVEVYTSTASLIFDERPETYGTKINAETWPQGIYFVKVFSDKGFEIEKMIKE